MKYDCHVEVFDPARWRVLTERSSPATRHGTVAQWMSFLQGSRTQGQVLVQPFAYHASHGCLLHAMQRAGPSTRAVAHLSRYMPSTEVDALHRAGVRGTRFVIAGQHVPDALDELAVLHHMMPSDWHIELSGSWQCLSRLSTALGHWGRLFVGTATDMWHAPLRDDDAKRLLRWMELGNFYAKLVLPERLMSLEVVAQRQPALAALIDAVADRLLWGSGWPDIDASWVKAIERTQGHGEPRLGEPIDLAPTLDRNARTVYGFAARLPGSESCGVMD